VGVVDDTVRRAVTDVPEPEIYYTPSHQAGAEQAQRLRSSTITLIVRSASDPRALVPSLRQIAAAAAPSAPLESVMTMKDKVAGSLAQPRLRGAARDICGLRAGDRR